MSKKKISDKKNKKDDEEESFLDGDDSKANLSVSKSDMNSKSKGNQKDEWRCLDCQKCYKSYPAFYTHNKLKHGGQPPKHYDIPRSLEDIRKDRGRPRVTDTNQRIKFTVQDKHQQRCEDNLYEFLGKLGQKGDETGQKENTVIRGYLQKTLDPVDKFPLDLFPQQNRELYQQIQNEIKVLNDELARNLEQWEFIDPLDLKPDDMSEFSIYNLKSLFYNLHITKKMSNKFTTLCVFLIWISKELLDDAYKEICLLAVTYTERYWTLIEGIIEKNQQEEPLALQARRERNSFKDEFLSNVRKNFEGIYDKLKIFNDQSDIKQFIEKFLAWYYHFDDEQIFEGQEKQELSEGINDHEDLDDDLDEEESESQGSGESEEGDDDDENGKAKKNKSAPGQSGNKAGKKSTKQPPNKKEEKSNNKQAAQQQQVVQNSNQQHLQTEQQQQVVTQNVQVQPQIQQVQPQIQQIQTQTQQIQQSSLPQQSAQQTFPNQQQIPIITQNPSQTQQQGYQIPSQQLNPQSQSLDLNNLTQQQYEQHQKLLQYQQQQQQQQQQQLLLQQNQLQYQQQPPTYQIPNQSYIPENHPENQQ